jgi:hypothetical protein
MAVHQEWSQSEEGEHSSDCLTIQNVAPSIDAIQNFKNPFDAVITFCGMRFPCEVHEIIASLLHAIFKSLFFTPNCFPIPRDFHYSFHNADLTKTQRHPIFAFANVRSILLFGEEGPAFPQFWRLAAEYYSGIGAKAAQKDPPSVPFTRQGLQLLTGSVFSFQFRGRSSRLAVI